MHPYCIYSEDKETIDDITAFLQKQIPKDTITVKPLYYEDWLLINRDSFHPIHYYPFSIIPSHMKQQYIKNRLPLYPKPLYIDAAAAFGTGSHPTTQSCLTLLKYLNMLGMTYQSICDIGTGSGILSFAAQYFWRDAMVIGCDIDDKAIYQANYNQIRNCNNMPCPIFVTSDKLHHRLIHRFMPYDMIIANILLMPLCDLAALIPFYTKPKSHVILSGIMMKQLPVLRKTYRYHGFSIIKIIKKEQWIAVLLRKK